MEQLSLKSYYPEDKYNLLGNTAVATAVPNIKRPVVQAVKLSPDPKDGDVYEQSKNSEGPQYAITKNGLKKLADGAGIKMISSEHVVPSTCQKCAAVNQHAGTVIQCGNCQNKDIAYRVTIGVPQLTGEILTVDDTHEIIVDSVTADMSDRQKKEFMKHLPQICEAKALNGAIRTALHIKGTYTKAELMKPFVVAYLIPNLDQEDVKQAAIESMFGSTNALFGGAPSVRQIEDKVPEDGTAAIEAADGADIDQYVDGNYAEVPAGPEEHKESDDEFREEDLYCDRCGEKISKKVWEYSTKYLERPLCYKCQKAVKGE